MLVWLFSVQIGQRQGGFFGLVENILSSAVPTIWFDRGEVFDRGAVTDRMKDHVATPGALPILIFPEGTCINNTSVMKFKKGCFEVGAVIHPVAIKVSTGMLFIITNPNIYLTL